jgi:AcrR family transcriptional regulator
MVEFPGDGDARMRVLDAAERLYARRGYTAVTLREIGREAGIHHTSLYHHVPGGKEALFVEVTERNLRRHRQGLERAIASASGNIRSQLRAVADWLLSQPPMDIVRLAHSDMPEIAPDHAERLSQLALESMIGPIQSALERARRDGEIDYWSSDLGLIAGGILGMVESLYGIPESALQTGAPTRVMMAHTLIDVLLDGLRSPQTPR